MNFQCLGSGSKGNSYLLTDSNGIVLIIELGLNMADIKKAIDFNLEKVAGAIVTHGHQ